MIRSEYNAVTGEYIEIELTNEEIAEREAKQAQIDAAKNAALAKREQALNKLAALGLELDDLKALGLG